ncbi:MAG: DUF2341 domain-containing protein [Bacteroidia bacterium]|nr:DUF2341 domain-containing protein [Bacteroidia bacterium]
MRKNINFNQSQRQAPRLSRKVLLGSGIAGFFLFLSFLIYNNLNNTESAYAGPTTDYGFGQRITIQASQISGSENLVDFPVLVQFTDSNLRTVANGGSVENSSGFDIFFTEDDCLTELDHHLDYYDPATGRLAIWVKIADLSATENSVIHLYYGNSDQTTDRSTNVWDSDYVGVYLLSADGDDKSSQQYSGTVNGATSVQGKIGNAYEFDGSNDYIQTNSSILDSLNNIQITAWIKNDVHSKVQHIVWQGNGVANGFGQPSNSLHEELHLSIGECCFTTNGSGTVANHLMAFLGVTEEQDDSTGLSAVYDYTDSLEWHFIKANFIDLAGTPIVQLYLDGTLLSTDTGTTAGFDRSIWDTDMRIGRPGANQRYFDGLIDQVMISNKIRSDDWLSTLVNNQDAPATFVSSSGHMTKSDLCSAILPVELIVFDAFIDDNKVALSWATASEINNDYFTVERSVDGIHWSAIAELPGAGSVNHVIDYLHFDDAPLPGTSYYRLKQTDFNGDFEYLGIRSVKFNNRASIDFQVYPNPAGSVVNLKFYQSRANSIDIINSAGARVIVPITKTGNLVQLNTGSLPSGNYYVIARNGLITVKKQFVILK